MSVIGKYDENSPRFGFHEWSLEATEEYHKFIKSIIKEGVQVATKEYKCIAYFPVSWDFGEEPCDGVGNAPVEDPSTIYVELPLGEDELENPVWKFTLTELIDDFISGCISPDGLLFDPIHHRSAHTLSNSLRIMADQLDAKC